MATECRVFISSSVLYRKGWRPCFIVYYQACKPKHGKFACFLTFYRNVITRGTFLYLASLFVVLLWVAVLVWAAVTEYHGPGPYTQQKLISQSPGSWKSDQGAGRSGVCFMDSLWRQGAPWGLFPKVANPIVEGAEAPPPSPKCPTPKCPHLGGQTWGRGAHSA